MLDSYIYSNWWGLGIGDWGLGPIPKPQSPIPWKENERINIGFEVLHRFTNTDYLDDVSKTYVDPAAFPLNPDGSTSKAFLLSAVGGGIEPPRGS